MRSIFFESNKSSGVPVTQPAGWGGKSSKLTRDNLFRKGIPARNRTFCYQIYLIAKRLLKEYNTHRKSLYLPDALIAATCLFAGYALLTFNKEDFRIIKNLKMK